LKDDLVKKSESLEKKLNDAILVLANDRKTDEINALKREQLRLQTMVDELKNTNDAAAITRLETAIKAAEDKLDSELKNILGGVFF
jgi:hypothetical protein